MFRVVQSLLAGMLLFCAVPAQAQHRAQYDEQYEQQMAIGVNQHDGFFLRLAGGLGPTSVESPVRGLTATLSGTSFLYSVAGGSAVAESFLVGGELWGLALSAPEVSWAGRSGRAESASIALVGYGLHLTYYFMPANVYFTVVPSLAKAAITYGGMTGESDHGFAIRLAVGKEWWASDDWGLGLSFQYARSSNGDGGGGTARTSCFGVAFSGTYN